MLVLVVWTRAGSSECALGFSRTGYRGMGKSHVFPSRPKVEGV